MLTEQHQHTVGAGSSKMSDSTSLERMEEVADVVLEFLEVAVHNILYHRCVYPASLFDRRRKYNVAVRMSRHPELNDYVFDVLKSSRDMFVKGSVERVDVVVLGPKGLPEERFMFNFDVSHVAGTGAPCTYADLERRLGAFLAKLSNLDVFLRSPKSDRTFTMLFHTHQAKEAALSEDWTPVPPGDPERLPVRGRMGQLRAAVNRGVGGAGAGAGAGSSSREQTAAGRVELDTRTCVDPAGTQRHVLPIKSLHAGPLSMQLFVEVNSGQSSRR